MKVRFCCFVRNRSSTVNTKDIRAWLLMFVNLISFIDYIQTLAQCNMQIKLPAIHATYQINVNTI